MLLPQKNTHGILSLFAKGSQHRQAIFLQQSVEFPLRHGLVVGLGEPGVVERHLEDRRNGRLLVGGAVGEAGAPRGGGGEVEVFVEAMKKMVGVGVPVIVISVLVVDLDLLDGLFKGRDTFHEVGDIKRKRRGSVGELGCHTPIKPQAEEEEEYSSVKVGLATDQNEAPAELS